MDTAWIFMIVGGTLVLLAAAATLLFLRGFFRVAEEERAVVEWAWGGYRSTAGPGLNWRFPILTHIRTFLDVWEREMPIFRSGSAIDLVDGSVVPEGAKLFARVIDPLTYEDPPRCIYRVENWENSIAVLAETLTTSYLRPFTIEQVLREGRGGFDLAFQIGHRRLELGRRLKELRDEASSARGVKQRLEKMVERDQTEKMVKDLRAAYNEIKKTREEWGVEITQIFIPEYRLGPEIVRAREEVHEAERRARAAVHRIEQVARESGGLHALVKKMLVEEGGTSAEEADQLAKEFVLYFRGTEKGSILDIRGEGLSAGLAHVVALLEKVKGTAQKP